LKILPKPVVEPNLCTNSVLRRAARNMGQLYDDVLSPSGLKGTQFTLLANIVALNEPTMRELADALVMDLSALGHALQPLSRDGWVMLYVDVRDRRAKRVKLSVDGLTRFKKAMSLWREAHGRFESAYGPEKAAALRSALCLIASEDFNKLFLRDVK
jgi:DNA-binding MarR family transcriptional regulator